MLFGFDELDFKGGQGNHGPSIIDGGNIGVNESGFIRGNDWRMNICANAKMVMSDNTMVVSDNLRMGDTSTLAKECDVYRVFNNQGANNNEESRTGPPIPFQPPPVKATPPLPSFACNPSNPVTVPAQQSAVMSPGVYGAVTWQNGTTVTLTAGTYTMCRITTGQNVRVITQPGVVIQVAQDFLINDAMRFDGSDCNDIPVVYVRADGVDPNNDNAVRFGENSEIWGHFYSPNGRLNLGRRTDLHGTFWAKSIGSDFNVDAEYCPPPLPEPETGNITVTKEVTGAQAGLAPDAEFTIHYNCTIPSPGVRNALDGNVTLAAGQTKKSRDVLVGTTCTVREVRRTPTLPGYVYEPAEFVPSRTVTVTADGQTVRLVIENPVRAVFGRIRVHKEVTGHTGGYRPGSRFGFALDCAADQFDATFTLARGETFVSDPVRVGVPCTVRETGLPRARPGFHYQQPVLSPASGQVTVGAEDQTVTVQVVNRLAGSRPQNTGPIGPSRSTSLSY
ncbi:MAG TPA: DUF5979 domain-containing protein [Nocardioides sp.]|uniref:DUF5979 domain-containing protein n=1 Tax=Nocardioides sp. TaxID=35761 RepID=UPI002E31B714|nr:DUF5979 domain-containing protein [Nocardioides sp.]HEX5086554.1 DUF5979 domain-containing protein [Nocardioides sp.]